MAISKTLVNPRLQRERRLAYLRDYCARRYANDPAFRERRQAQAKARYARLKELAAIGAAVEAGNGR
jgi:hypothetical protein